MSASLCQIIFVGFFTFFVANILFIFTRLALKHFYWIEIFLLLFLTLVHLFLSNNKIHVVVTHWICILSCFHWLRNLLVLKSGLLFGSYFSVNMFLLKSLPQGLFCSEDANSYKLILCCYHAAGLGLWDTVNVLQVAEKQNKARTVITNKHRIQNVPKWSEDLVSY